MLFSLIYGILLDGSFIINLAILIVSNFDGFAIVDLVAEAIAACLIAVVTIGYLVISIRIIDTIRLCFFQSIELCHLNTLNIVVIPYSVLHNFSLNRAA